VIEDDDEVTLAHAPAARDYQPVSEAMINIRRTLAKAAREGVVRAATAECLAEIGKAFFYPFRTYEKILEEGLRRKMPARELHDLHEWLGAGRVDQKRLDAVAMLTRMRQDVQVHPRRKRVSFTFQNTDGWDHARRTMSSRRPYK
jgi:hypothetical protein